MLVGLLVVYECHAADENGGDGSEAYRCGFEVQ